MKAEPKACEFLLQREGDDTWIPVEAPTVEILEGRYRILGRTRHPNQDIQVQISYWDLEEVPPQRHSKHQTRRTSAKGLAALLSYTQFKAGRWEIQCSSDFMADFSGTGWNDRVTFEVLPQSEEGFDPSLLDNLMDVFQEDEAIAAEPAPAANTPATREDTGEIAAARLQELAAKMSQLVVESVLNLGGTATLDAAGNAIEPGYDDHYGYRSGQSNSPSDGFDRGQFSTLGSAATTSAAATSTPALAQAEPLVEVFLAEEVYVAQRGCVLALAGAVQPLVSETWLASHAVVVRLELRDPETLAILLGLQQTLPPFSVQAPFSFDFMLPSDLTVPLILGEVQVCCAAAALQGAGILAPGPGDGNRLICIGRHHFSVTASPVEILEQIQQTLDQLDRKAIAAQTAGTTPPEGADRPLTATPPLSAAVPNAAIANPAIAAMNPTPANTAENGDSEEIQVLLRDFAQEFAEALVEGTEAPDRAPQHLLKKPSTPHSAPTQSRSTATKSLNLDFLKFVQQPPTLETNTWRTSTPGELPPRLNSRWPQELIAAPRPVKAPPKDGLDLPTFPKASGAIDPKEVEYNSTDPSAISTDPGFNAMDLGAIDPKEVEYNSTDPRAISADSSSNSTDSSFNAKEVEYNSTDPRVIPTDPRAISADSSLADSSLADSSFNAMDLGAIEADADASDLFDLADFLDFSDLVETLGEEPIAVKPGEVAQGDTFQGNTVQSDAFQDAAFQDGAFQDDAFPDNDLPLTDTLNLLADLESVLTRPAQPLEPSAPDLTPNPADNPADNPATSNLAANNPAPEAAENPQEAATSPNLADVFQSRFFQRLSALATEESQDWLSEELENVPATPTLEALTGEGALPPQALAYGPDALDPLQNLTDLEILTDEALTDLERLLASDTRPSLTEANLDPAEAFAWAAADEEILGPESLGPESLGPESLDPNSLDPAAFNAEGTAGRDDRPGAAPNPALDPEADELLNWDPYGLAEGAGEAPESYGADRDPSEAESLQFDNTGAILGTNPIGDDLPPHLHLEALPDPRTLLNLEIVVEDDRIEVGQHNWLQLTDPEIEAFPVDLPLPLPRLELPQGEWIGGQAVPVSLFLPETLAQLCVRLWMVDCQSRTVVGDPLWITRFLPTLPGFLEARFDLPVPEGCLEIQVEAMTVEPTTQRESHKISLQRSIVPAELANADPTGLLEAFEPWSLSPKAPDLPLPQTPAPAALSAPSPFPSLLLG
ncbi:MAG: hypothetical protein ACO331_02840 [Prochlorothrix sp.]